MSYKWHQACMEGDLIKVRVILADDENVLDATDFDAPHKTALMLAASLGHLHVCEFLLSHGCSTLKQDDLKFTALHYACLSNHQDIAELIVAKGGPSTLRVKNIYKETPISYAKTLKFSKKLKAAALMYAPEWDLCLKRLSSSQNAPTPLSVFPHGQVGKNSNDLDESANDDADTKDEQMLQKQLRIPEVLMHRLELEMAENSHAQLSELPLVWQQMYHQITKEMNANAAIKGNSNDLTN